MLSVKLGLENQAAELQKESNSYQFLLLLLLFYILALLWVTSMIVLGYIGHNNFRLTWLVPSMTNASYLYAPVGSVLSFEPLVSNI